MPSHICALAPSAASRRNAISTEIPALPFRMRDNAVRVMRRREAASVTVRPSRYSRRTFPGCGGLNIRGIVTLRLVVVLIIDQDNVLSVKLKVSRQLPLTEIDQ